MCASHERGFRTYFFFTTRNQREYARYNETNNVVCIANAMDRRRRCDSFTSVRRCNSRSSNGNSNVPRPGMSTVMATQVVKESERHRKDTQDVSCTSFNVFRTFSLPGRRLSASTCPFESLSLSLTHNTIVSRGPLEKQFSESN